MLWLSFQAMMAMANNEMFNFKYFLKNYVSQTILKYLAGVHLNNNYNHRGPPI